MSGRRRQKRRGALKPGETAWAALRTELAARGLKPKKELGQNFMVDGNFARALVAAAAPDEKTLLLEVGPGPGALTTALLAAHPQSRVLALELDRGLAGFLRDKLAAEISAGRLTLLEGDVLTDKNTLHEGWWEEAGRIVVEENRPRVVVAANLPYNAATPFLMNLMQTPPPRSFLAAATEKERHALFVREAVTTVQKEVGERLLSTPGKAAYGPPAVLRALRAEGEILRRAHPEVFRPRPRVDSVVVRLRFRPWQPEPEAPDEDGTTPPKKAPLREDEYEPCRRFLTALFSQRRKTLRTALRALFGDAPATGRGEKDCLADFPDKVRAEDLPPETLLALFRSRRG